MRLAVALALVAACSTPPLTIRFEIASNGMCPGATCGEIPMTCDSMRFVRVVDPNQHPEVAYLSDCKQILVDSGKDLCAIASVALPVKSLPERTLEVQVVVLPLELDENGQPDCDSQVPNLQFSSATGLLVADENSPPIGGRAFYHPGDAETIVPLGCNFASALNSSCEAPGQVTVNAAVEDFLTALPVSSAIADHLTVSVGEPHSIIAGGSTEFTLEANAVQVLERTPNVSSPGWTGSVDTPFMAASCIEVLDDAPASTATLLCAPAVTGKTSLDLGGVHLPQSVLAKITAAIPDPMFSLDKGVVLGIVLDNVGSAVPGLVVTATDPAATVHYLTDDATPQFNGTSTSTNGIFLSTDAAFQVDGTLTHWTTQHGAPGQIVTAQGFGGLVDGKITIVVLQFSATIST